MEDLQEFILHTLNTTNSINDTSSLQELSTIPSTTICSVLKSLESHEMINFTQIEQDNWKLTEEGELILQNGITTWMLLWLEKGIKIPKTTFNITICWHFRESHFKEYLSEFLSLYNG